MEKLMNEVKYYLPLPLTPELQLPVVRGERWIKEKKNIYALGGIDRWNRENEFLEKYSDRIVHVHRSLWFREFEYPVEYELQQHRHIFFTDSKIELLYQLTFGKGLTVVKLQRRCTLWEKIKDLVKNI